MTDTRTRLLELAAWHQRRRFMFREESMRTIVGHYGAPPLDVRASLQEHAMLHHDASVTLVEAAEYLRNTVRARRAQACERAGVTMDAAMLEACGPLRGQSSHELAPLMNGRRDD